MVHNVYACYNARLAISQITVQDHVWQIVQATRTILPTGKVEPV